MNYAYLQLQELLKKLNEIIIGKSNTIEKIVIALLAEGHVLIEDVPGVGKTTLVESLSKLIDGSFRRLQFTPDTLPSDIIGLTIYNPRTESFNFQPGVIMTNILLGDEINRTSPKTQSSLLQAMEEKKITVDGTTYPLLQPFMVLATQNPIEHIGTYPLPEAQLDRFLMKISLGYPSLEEEIKILTNFGKHRPLEDLSYIMHSKDLIVLQNQCKEVFVEEDLKKFIVKIIQSTRKHPDLILGCSPRASLALYRAVQARALIHGRDFVIPEDILDLSSYVLCHRLLLTQEAKVQRKTAQIVMDEILQKIPLPAVVKKP